MNIRRVIKCFALWATIWIAGGILLGIVMGLGDTGHVGFLGTVIILTTAGALVGAVGGITFAPLFAWVAQHLPTRFGRTVIAAVIGSSSGLLGIYVADCAVGIADAFTIGGIAGAVIGFVCGAFSILDHEHHATVA